MTPLRERFLRACQMPTSDVQRMNFKSLRITGPHETGVLDAVNDLSWESGPILCRTRPCGVFSPILHANTP